MATTPRAVTTEVSITRAEGCLTVKEEGMARAHDKRRVVVMGITRRVVTLEEGRGLLRKEEVAERAQELSRNWGAVTKGTVRKLVTMECGGCGESKEALARGWLLPRQEGTARA